MANLHRVVLAALLSALLGSQASNAKDATGVVLLHDKNSTPDTLSALSGGLAAAGFLVQAPEMCWSRGRIYDRSFAGCLLEVEDATKRLMAEGATRIVVGGEGLGALGAFAYAAIHPELAGVIAMAPSANPASLASIPNIAWQVTAAQAAVTYGQGNTTVRFADQLGGKAITVNATPKNYLDFLGPQSPILATKILPKLKMPLLWIRGAAEDPRSPGSAAFKRAPANSLSTALKFDAVDTDLPAVSVTAVSRWLRLVGGE